MSVCAKCGAPLAPDAQFCSKCGTPVVPAPPEPPLVTPAPVMPVSAVPVAPARRSTWWIVPLVIVGLVLVAWLLLAGLPFGRDKQVVATATTETIAEGTAPAQPAQTGTIVEVGDTIEPPLATETAPPPPITTQTVPPVVTQTQPLPAPVIVEDRPIPRPAPVTPLPQPRPTPPPEEPRGTPRNPEEPVGGEISEGEASGVLRGHLASNNPYDVAANCLQVRSGGYRNVGYTFSVWDTCVSGGGSRMLGRWRVDSKTREVFRQRDDGRFLRP
ncbi:MAG TPA: zinc-ribbon domain-containing protein [Thermoanaerobaculia bacterium]|nr:zinc-ribbon domain-containing protein [Thermoanaerobaculia bacterium]